MKFKYDLHIHTQEVSPCGHLSVEEIIDNYIASGYSGLVLTDHLREDFFENCSRDIWREKLQEYFYSYDRAIEYCKDKDFFIGLGMEIRFNGNINDFLVYGFEREDFYENPYMIEMGLESFYNKFKDKAVIIEAHPHRDSQSCLDDINFLHGLEIYNSNPRHDSRNELTEEFVKLNRRLIGTAGSDSHRIEDLCKTGIITNEKINTDNDLLEILRSKSFSIIRSN